MTPERALDRTLVSLGRLLAATAPPPSPRKRTRSASAAIPALVAALLLIAWDERAALAAAALGVALLPTIRGRAWAHVLRPSLIGLLFFGILLPLPALLRAERPWVLPARVFASLFWVRWTMATASFHGLLDALGRWGAPPFLLSLLSLTRRSTRELGRILEERLLARRSRSLGRSESHPGRRWLAAQVTFLLQRTERRVTERHDALRSRALRAGEVLP
jgi:energy-coupling factor transporter transmembrane protein EcfT